MQVNNLSFENTENAFAYKSDKDLLKARFLFSSMSYKTLVKIGTTLTPLIIKSGLPVKEIIRRTIFDQFVGGESLEETASVVNKLKKFGVNVILDYGVEGKEGEENFEHSCEEFIRVIKYASAQPDIPFISIKVTGFARFSLLEKLDAAANDRSGYTGHVHTEVLTAEEKIEWNRVTNRMERVIEAAASAGNIGVLVDAEESWIQDPVDALTILMMEKYNTRRAIVYNTVQLYRKDRLQFLKNSFEEARNKNYLPAVKLVRGAYMEKERKRARQLNYDSPIQDDKASTDRDYNLALKFCISNIESLVVIVATHNEYSNLYATRLMNDKQIKNNHPHIHFSQLFGMSDNITFNLSREGYSVSKYLPFGPIKDVIPYLMRRAQENSSVAGQTGRELALIKKEVLRRSKT